VKTGYGKKHRAGNSGSKEKKSGGHYGSGTEQNQARPQRCRKQEKKQKNQAVAVAKISGIQSKKADRITRTTRSRTRRIFYWTK
jgi:hypothetical protein